jgi:hypothetical protein
MKNFSINNEGLSGKDGSAISKERNKSEYNNCVQMMINV